jgi:hypothetical protein
MEPQIKSKDTRDTLLGMLLGIVLPFFALFLFYLRSYSNRMQAGAFMELLFEKNLFAPLIALCCITNLVGFFVLYFVRKNYAARGIIFATLLFALYVVYTKLI